MWVFFGFFVAQLKDLDFVESAWQSSSFKITLLN